MGTSKTLGQGIPESVERKLASGARHSERAIVVGSRGGIIEWANDAWTRVTGYALDESISKPVQGFLDGIDIDGGVIDFVAGCYEQGRVCELEFPVTPPQRTEQWIQLRVEPLFDADGRVSDFIATATDVTERKLAGRAAHLSEVDLSQLAAKVARQSRSAVGETVVFDCELARGLPLVLADPEKIERLVARRIAHGAEQIGAEWGAITLWTGILGAGLGPLHAGNLWRGLPPGQWVFLEVHDTGASPAGRAVGPVTEPFLSTRSPGHAIRFAEAESWLRGQGGELRLESSVPDGTSVVLLLPFAAEDSGWHSEGR